MRRNLYGKGKKLDFRDVSISAINEIKAVISQNGRSFEKERINKWTNKTIVKKNLGGGSACLRLLLLWGSAIR